ncbi:hypothetical protein CCP2SC5_700008 [Azospirillaceae bacterium]
MRDPHSTRLFRFQHLPTTDAHKFRIPGPSPGFHDASHRQPQQEPQQLIELSDTHSQSLRLDLQQLNLSDRRKTDVATRPNNTRPIAGGRYKVFRNMSSINTHNCLSMIAY